MTEAEAFYLPDRGGFVGTVLAQGAWDPRTQTGVAVLALLGHVLEDIPTLAPMTMSRITVDMVRPVPIHRRMVFTPSIVREGKKLQVLDLSLVVDDIEHARARCCGCGTRTSVTVRACRLRPRRSTRRRRWSRRKRSSRSTAPRALACCAPSTCAAPR